MRYRLLKTQTYQSKFFLKTVENEDHDIKEHVNGSTVNAQNDRSFYDHTKHFSSIYVLLGVYTFLGSLVFYSIYLDKTTISH